MPIAPGPTPDAIATLTLAHLERVVAIDSQSDEASTTLPTTEGQRHLADYLARFYEGRSSGTRSPTCSRGLSCSRASPTFRIRRWS